MTLKLNGFWSPVLWMLRRLVLRRRRRSQNAQPEPAAACRADSAQQSPTFRVQIDAVTMDVIVKDDQGRFVPDLKKDEFEIYEDGVKQDISSMTMSHGGRVTNVLEAPPPPPPEGIILPPVRRVVDTSGRIFLFFVDDLHLQFQNSGRVRELFKKIREEPDSRRRSVRHRLERSVVDLAGHDLRPQALRRGDQEDRGQRAEAERDHQRGIGLGRSDRAALQRARRVLDDARKRSTISRRCTTAARRWCG